jgi:MarR family transcriptional regulator for hemolysin
VLEYDFEESLGYWLTIATQGMHRAFNDELSPHGLTFRQSQVLLWLVLKKELSQNQLAALMQIEPPTLAGIVDRMLKAGWITRRSCPNDRRKKLVRISPKAEPVWETIVECAHTVRAKAEERLTPSEATELKRLLSIVAVNFATEPLLEFPASSTSSKAKALT